MLPLIWTDILGATAAWTDILHVILISVMGESVPVETDLFELVLVLQETPVSTGTLLLQTSADETSRGPLRLRGTTIDLLITTQS